MSNDDVQRPHENLGGSKYFRGRAGEAPPRAAELGGARVGGASSSASSWAVGTLLSASGVIAAYAELFRLAVRSRRREAIGELESTGDPSTGGIPLKEEEPERSRERGGRRRGASSRLAERGERGGSSTSPPPDGCT